MPQSKVESETITIDLANRFRMTTRVGDREIDYEIEGNLTPAGVREFINMIDHGQPARSPKSSLEIKIDGSGIEKLLKQHSETIDAMLRGRDEGNKEVSTLYGSAFRSIANLCCKLGMDNSDGRTLRNLVKFINDLAARATTNAKLATVEPDADYKNDMADAWEQVMRLCYQRGMPSNDKGTLEAVLAFINKNADERIKAMAITQQCIDEMVERFLTWPLPFSVCADLCATSKGGAHRTGTNLLDATEARQMLEHVLQVPSAPVIDHAGISGDFTNGRRNEPHDLKGIDPRAGAKHIDPNYKGPNLPPQTRG